jgi:hypothetical protein
MDKAENSGNNLPNCWTFALKLVLSGLVSGKWEVALYLGVAKHW